MRAAPEIRAMAQLPPHVPPAHITPQPKRSGIHLHVNGKPYLHAGDPDMPLLWWLHDYLQLTGTKYACGIGACGACSVLIDGEPAHACLTPMQTLQGRKVITVEGLAQADGGPSALQQAWIDEDAILCGYCQAGQLIAAHALLQRHPQPSEADLDSLPNLCRCGSYPRIRKAVQRAARSKAGKPDAP
ncbi:isoquinoline 1-oxidoreductase alpha subunit, partial [mine drainage metagenome]